jgi:KDO transferase-3
VRRLYRCFLSRKWKHRYEYGPLFEVRDQDGLRSLLWDNQVYCRHELKRPEPQSTELLIVASGPSVQGLDFTRFAKADVMMVNGAIALAQQKGIRPAFHLAVDPDFFIHRQEYVLMGLQLAGCSILSTLGLSVLAKRRVPLKGFHPYAVEMLPKNWSAPRPADWLLKEGSPPDWLWVRHQTNGSVAWSRRPDLGVAGGGTVVYVGLQLACWLGYQKIYIAGMDLHGPAVSPRFYEEKQADVRPSGLDRDYLTMIEPSFRLFASLSSRLDCNVYNLSPASRLPDSLIKKLRM